MGMARKRDAGRHVDPDRHCGEVGPHVTAFNAAMGRAGRLMPQVRLLTGGRRKLALSDALGQPFGENGDGLFAV